MPRRSQSIVLLEGLVTHSEHLVEQEDVEVDLDRDRVREPEQHAGGVVLQLLVDEPLELGEADNVVEPRVQLAAGESEKRAVHADVVARVQLEVEADAKLDEGREQAVDSDDAAVGR